MKLLKKILCLPIIFTATTFGLIGCGGEENPASSDSAKEAMNSSPPSDAGDPANEIMTEMKESVVKDVNKMAEDTSAAAMKEVEVTKEAAAEQAQNSVDTANNAAAEKVDDTIETANEAVDEKVNSSMKGLTDKLGE